MRGKPCVWSEEWILAGSWLPGEIRMIQTGILRKHVRLCKFRQSAEMLCQVYN